MKQVIVLAAGISSRMRPLTNDRPKPMLLLGGRPIMEYVIVYLRSAGFVDIVITTHYLPDVIMGYFGNGSNFGADITYSYEEPLLGTAGSLKLIEDRLHDEFLVCGGHFFLPALDLGDMIRFHRERGGLGTVAFKRLTDKNLLKFFGQGIFDSEQKLVGFHEKPCRVICNYVHTTYQIYRKEVVELIPSGIPLSIPDFLIPKLLERGESVYGYFTESELINVSTIELYERARKLIDEL